MDEVEAWVGKAVILSDGLSPIQALLLEVLVTGTGHNDSAYAVLKLLHASGDQETRMAYRSDIRLADEEEEP